MKITAAKVKKELENNYGWILIDERGEEEDALINAVIKDTLSVVNKILLYQKNISIK